MNAPEYTAEQALNLLIAKLKAKDESLAAQVQAAIDAGKDVTETEPATDRRKKARLYRKTVPFSREEALQVALDALQAYFVEQPLFVNAAADNLAEAAVGVPVQQGATHQVIGKDSEPVSLEGQGVEKTVEIELQTETQISRSGEETMPLKRMPKALIEEQRQHLTRLRELTAFACIPDKDLDRIARAIHDANRRRLKRDNSFTLRDPAQVGWTELQAAMKDATRDRASWIVMMLRAMGLTLRAVPSGRDPAVFFLAPGEVEEMAKMEHERWVSAKLRDGWQYGPNRDDNRRSHPCLVPWDQLGPSEQERDRVVVREIPQVVASAGYEIVRM